MRLLTAVTVAIVAALATAKAAEKRAYSTRNRYEANYSATWNKLNSHDNDIQNLKTLTNALTPGQVAFLASINQMTAIGGVPMGNDGFSGPNWGTGERDYVNAPIDVINALIPKLQRSNLMQF